jgi:hypothetical protein
LFGEKSMKFDKLINNFLNEDIIPGGNADKLEISDIAKKHGVTVDHIKKQIKMGIKVEMEHTDDKKIAYEVAMDHMSECPNYYTKLAKMEKTCKVSEMTSTGGVFGTGGTIGGIYDPSSNKISSNDSYAPGDSRNIFGGSKKQKSKKRKKKNMFDSQVIQRRVLSKTL